MADINKLLNKKGWSGKDLGVLELTNTAVLFQQAVNGEPEKPLIDKNKFQLMINRLTAPSDIRTYNDYLSIHEWTGLKYNIAQSHMQQAQVQFRTLEAVLSQCLLAESTFIYISQLPVIMTEKQHNDFIHQRLEAYCIDDNGNELKIELFPLLLKAIDYYVKQLDSNPKKANPLKAIRKKYSEKPLKSGFITQKWNELEGYGYLQLPDGSRSDQMTQEEWWRTLEEVKPKQKEFRDQLKRLEDSGEISPQEKEDLIFQFRKERKLEEARLIYSGMTPEEADAFICRQDIKAGNDVETEWHSYDSLPADLVKWNVIESSRLEELYPLSVEDAGSVEAFTEAMEDFKAEYAELTTALLKDIDKKVFNSEKKLHELPITEWANASLSKKELFESGYPPIVADAHGREYLYNDNSRARLNGVTIIDSVGNGFNIDENGYYIEPELDYHVHADSLEALFPESTEYATYGNLIETSRETLLTSYYFLEGYNYTIDAIAEIHEIPEYKVFKMDINDIENRINILNDMSPLLYKKILAIDYDDNQLKEKKLQALKDFFPTINYKDVVIPQEKKREMREMIKTFEAFRPEKAEYYYYLLCTRPKEEV